MDKPRKKVWITKYALTTGIIAGTAEICDGKYAHMSYGSGKLFTAEFQYSLDSAREVAERMRVARIKSLKKQLVKLEELEIKIV